MAELKTRKTKASVTAFLQALPDAGQRQDAVQIKKIMQELSGHRPAMWGPSIIGFGECRLRYASGRELDWPLVAFSPRKGSLSLYLNLGCLPEAERLLKGLGKHKLGKGCLYLKRLADVDLATLRKLIQMAIDDAKERGGTCGHG